MTAGRPGNISASWFDTSEKSAELDPLADPQILDDRDTAVEFAFDHLAAARFHHDGIGLPWRGPVRVVASRRELRNTRLDDLHPPFSEGGSACAGRDRDVRCGVSRQSDSRL